MVVVATLGDTGGDGAAASAGGMMFGDPGFDAGIGLEWSFLEEALMDW